MNKEYQENLLEFWMKLLPNIKDRNELDSFIKKYWDYKLEDVLQEISVIQNDICSVDMKYSCEQENEYDKMFDKLSEKYMWSEFLRSILKRETIELRKIIYESTIVGNKEKLFENLFKSMLEGCYSISLRVIYEEYNNINRDKTPEEDNSTKSFNEMLFDSKYISYIHNSHPELIRILRINLKNFLELISDILCETKINIDCIKENINEQIRVIENIEVSMGDSHRGGKSVCVLLFNDGIKIVYKPRKLESEIAFFSLIDYLNAKKIKNFCKLKKFKFYTCKNHGWVEFIDYEQCEDEQQVKNFYLRMGELLGILYILNAKDFHSENIICSKEHPILIDLETLLHGVSFETGLKLGGACDEALDLVNNSVMKIGLLPMTIVNPKNGKHINIGAMGSEGEQESPFASLAVIEDEKGKVSIKQYYSTLNYKNNIPRINQEVKKAVYYIDSIIFGFEIVYDYIHKNKDEFVRDIKKFFENIEHNRIIIRSTNVYDQLLRTSYHPDLLMDKWSRKIFLLKLLEVTDVNISDDIFKAELLDMYNGDIPFFSCNLKTEDIVDSRNNVLNSSMKIEMMTQMINKINNLSMMDKKRQIGFIRVSFLEEMEKNGVSDEKLLLDFLNLNKKNSKLEVDYSEIVERLIKIILSQRITTKKEDVNKCVWLEVNRNPGWPTFISYTKPDLYAGLIGMYLVLNMCEDISKNEDLSLISKQIKEAILHNYNDILANNKPILGAFTGVFGIIYMLCKEVRSESSLDILSWCIRNINISDVNENDIIGGGAGIIKVLLLAKKLLGNYQNKYTLEIDEINRANAKLINHIKESAIRDLEYIHWGEEGYVGYAHGTAGIIDALTDYYRDTHDGTILSYIKGGYAYISQNFSTTERNWFKDKNRNVYSKGWCHGAPGILLLQLNLLKTFNEKIVNTNDLRDTVNIIIDNGFGEDYCLCHGDMGNLIILNKVASCLDDSKLKKNVKQQLKITILELREKIYGDYFYYKENWSLMLGVPSILAGILDIEYEKDLCSLLTLN